MSENWRFIKEIREMSGDIVVGLEKQVTLQSEKEISSKKKSNSLHFF